MNQSVLELLKETVGVKGISELLARQKNLLTETDCTDTRLGKWLDDFSLPFLTHILSSSEAEFEAEFPGMRFSKQHRVHLLKEIIEHEPSCPRCSLKVECDAELDAVFAPAVSARHCGQMSAGQA